VTGPADGPMRDLMSQLANLQQAFGGAAGTAGPGGPAVVEIVGSAGGGAVRVRVGGDLEFSSVEISPEVVDAEDVSVLEDLVLAALRDAAEQLRHAAESNLNEMVGGALSGLFGAIGEAGAWGAEDDELDDDELEDDELGVEDLDDVDAEDALDDGESATHDDGSVVTDARDRPAPSDLGDEEPGSAGASATPGR
jgi:DNA-binding protein YbaB